MLLEVGLSFSKLRRHPRLYFLRSETSKRSVRATDNSQRTSSVAATVWLPGKNSENATLVPAWPPQVKLKAMAHLPKTCHLAPRAKNLPSRVIPLNLFRLRIQRTQTYKRRKRNRCVC